MVSIDIEVSAYLIWVEKNYPLIVLQSDQNVVSFFTCRLRAEISSSSVLLLKKSIAALTESYHHHTSVDSNAEILELTMYLP